MSIRVSPLTTRREHLPPLFPHEPLSLEKASDIVKRLTNPEVNFGQYDLKQPAPNKVTDEEINILNDAITNLVCSKNSNNSDVITNEHLESLIRVSFQGDYILMILQENAMDLLNRRNQTQAIREEYIRQTANVLSLNETYPVIHAAEILGLTPYTGI